MSRSDAAGRGGDAGRAGAWTPAAGASVGRPGRRTAFRAAGAAVAMAAAATGLAACGSGNGADASATGATRQVTDATGAKVAVPEHPRRIVTLSEPTLDGALALKAHVIGTTSGRGQAGAPAYLAKRAAGVPVMASVAGPNLEKIAAAKPDLILADASVRIDDGTRAKLGRIAPTVTVSKRGQSWNDAFTAEARVLNLASRGRGVLAAYRDRVAKVKARLGPNANAKISIVRWNSGEPSVLMAEQPASRVAADLGLSRPASQDHRGPGHAVPISLENLDKIDADWLFFGTLGGASGGKGDTNAGAAKVGKKASAKLLAKARSTPGFRRLHAVRDGHVVPVDGTAWTSAGGPLAVNTVLTDMAEALAPDS